MAEIRRKPLIPRTGTAQEVDHKLPEVQSHSNIKFPDRYQESSRHPPRAVLEWNWTLESIACLCSVGALVAIFAILRAYNGRALDEWPYSITLNSLISVLVVLLRACMAVPLAEGLAQLKWSWFRQGNPLRDLTVLNAASTTILGAATVLVRFLPRHLVSLGSFILIAGVAIGPFAQQVVLIRSRMIVFNTGASVAVCNTTAYSDWVHGGGPGLDLAPLQTIGAIYEGILQAGNQNNNSVTPTCNSGNCTFGTYQSLGFCSQCADISSRIIPEGVCDFEESDVWGCTLRVPGSVAIRLADRSTINATVRSDLIQVDVKDVPLILNFTAITNPGGMARSLSDIKATECALYFCVKTYSAEVNGGQLTETITPTTMTTNFTDFWIPSSLYSVAPRNCIVNGTDKQPPYDNADGCTYIIEGFSGLALVNSLSPLLNGTGSRQVSNRPLFSSDTVLALESTSPDGFESIDSVFQSLATGLTTHARSQVCGGSANGTSWTSEPYINVQYPWMALPTIVVGLNVVFFVATLLHTRNQYIWKSSPLPLLFLGSNADLPESANDDLRLSHMEEVSERIHLRFESTDNSGVKLVGRLS